MSDASGAPEPNSPAHMAPLPGTPAATDPVQTIAHFMRNGTHILRATTIILGVCALLWVLASAFVTMTLAVFFAVLLRGIGNFVHRHTRLSISASVLLVFFLLVLGICGLGYWIGPRFTNEGQQLWTRVSGSVGNLSNMFGSHSQIVGSTGTGNPASLAFGHTSMIAGMLKTVASSAVGLLAAILVIVATGVYLALSPDMYINGISHLTPLWYQARTRRILLEMGKAIQGWMLGQLIDMVVVGVIVGIGLTLIGTPLAGVLAIVAGVCTFIPYFGTIISAVPAIIVALTVNVQEVIWVIGVFAVAHSVEGYIIAPFVQRRTVHLPPALTLFSFVALVAIFNIFGLLIATPLMACIMVAVARVYVEDILGDPAGRRITVKSRWYWFTPPDDTAQTG